jgi:PqqD family protein of HPr-rel-A system
MHLGAAGGHPKQGLEVNSFVTAHRRTDLLVRAMNGEIVVLDKGSKKIHHLNATASLIWRCCDGNNSADAIAATVAEHFNCPVHAVIDDVRGFLRQLEVLGLIESSVGHALRTGHALAG